MTTVTDTVAAAAEEPPAWALFDAARGLAEDARALAAAGATAAQVVKPVEALAATLMTTGESLTADIRPLESVRVQFKAPEVATPWSPSEAQYEPPGFVDGGTAGSVE